MNPVNLTEQQKVLLQRTKKLAHTMDAQWQIGSVRLGYDSVLGLVPGFGDILSALIALKVIFNAKRLGAPVSLISVMIVNVAAEMFAGKVPVLGDMVDVFWRAI